MQGLAICAGIGGLELGIHRVCPAYRTVCYVEREAYSAAVLASRMAQGQLSDAPVWSDVATFDPRPWRHRVDLVTAGYPCQPFSLAGRRQGTNDARHLWPHIWRIVAVIRPPMLFCENVPGHLSLGLRQVWDDLRRLGYCIEAGLFSASEQGAPHVRKRLFLLAADADSQRCVQGRIKSAIQLRRHRPDCRSGGLGADLADADGQGQSQPSQGKSQKRRRLGNGRGQMADADADGQGLSQRQGIRGDAPALQPTPVRGGQDPVKSRLGHPSNGSAGWLGPGWPEHWEHGVLRVTSGCDDRAHQLRALGNAVVPQVAGHAFLTLLNRHTQQTAKVLPLSRYTEAL